MIGSEPNQFTDEENTSVSPENITNLRQMAVKLHEDVESDLKAHHGLALDYWNALVTPDFVIGLVAEVEDLQKKIDARDRALIATLELPVRVVQGTAGVERCVQLRDLVDTVRGVMAPQPKAAARVGIA
jgi:hypothetical protein